MATHNAYRQLTLVELAKRKDPDGNLATIAEVLAEDNEILQDAIWQPSNDTFSYKVVRRSSLPTGSWRKFNEGVSIEASRTVEELETIGMLETFARNDVDLIKGFPNPTKARMDEAISFLEGMGQTLAETMVYGNASTTPETFTGLAPRMDALATTTNVLDSGGSGSDLTSIFVIMWAPNKVFMTYPKGDPNIGIRHEDLGIETVEPSAGTLYRAYVDHFQIKAGMVVKDPRCIGRISNIETTGTSNTFDEDDIIRLLNRMPGRGKGAKIYVNDTVLTQMEIRLKDKNNVNYVPGKGEGLVGEPAMYFRSNPIRLVDQILITEAALA